ncbi:MAG: TraR/DksA C4-type zinc finger protein [Paracoccaceae bacterium]|nr:TraR/DksA C4-type zinc finger protein [Paracoccaceae bacterium]
MTDTDRAVRKRLEARLAALDETGALGADDRAIVALDQQSVGRLSRVDALRRQAMAAANDRRRAAERSRLIVALGRLDDGEYGVCQDCGEEIAPARLELDPAAALCVSCARG